MAANGKASNGTIGHNHQSKNGPSTAKPSTTNARPLWREDKANFFSYIFLWWLNPLMALGKQRPLVDADLPDVRDDTNGKTLYSKFSAQWEKEVSIYEKNKAEDTATAGRVLTAEEKIHRSKREIPSVARALNRAFGFRFWLAGLAKLVADATSFTMPILLENFLKYLANARRTIDPPPERDGYLWAMSMFLCAFIGIIFTNETFRTSSVTGLQVRGALTTAIYQKSLKLSPGARAKMNIGEIGTMMSVDCSKIDMMFQFFHLGWTSIFNISAAIGLLARAVGASTAVAVGVVIFFLPIQISIMKKLGMARFAAAKETDQRTKVLSEILQGIRVIKLYAWEKSFLKKLLTIRDKEVSHVARGTYARAMNNVINTFAPVFMLLVTYITYSKTRDIHDASAVFSALILLNLLRWPLILLPFVLSSSADSKVGFARIEKFLLAEELKDKPKLIEGKVKNAVEIIDGEFSWEAIISDQKDKKDKPPMPLSSAPPSARVPINTSNDTKSDEIETPRLIPSVLKDINVSIEHGKLVAVVGAVASGKSSFLSGILGELKRVRGQVLLNGKVAYMSQQAWIQNTTLRDNVTFGQPFNNEKYQNAIRVCALSHDISVLPAGDGTEIGERGINLSGGQKQRVSIARAVYFDADIYLFDDPLSAVDAHVSKHIFHECIVGHLRDKTRILVTHQLQYCPLVDEIIFLRDGRIEERGTFSELMSNKNGRFYELMNTYGGQKKDDDEPGEESDANNDKSALLKKDEEKQLVRKVSEKAVETKGSDDKNKAKLMTTEERTTGGVKWETIAFYIACCGGWSAVIIFFGANALQGASRFICDNWLKDWVSNNYSLSDDEYIGVYTGLTFAQLITAVVLNYFAANRSVFSARNLHDVAFKNVLRAPMSFFDTTPIGRILNRFTRDQDTIDNLLLNESLRMAVFMAFNAFGSLIMIAVYNKWFAIAIPFIIIVYDQVQRYYRASSRELKRLDSLSRSPLFAHFSETLMGLSTIRAYNHQEEFIEGNYQRMDGNNRPYFLLQCSGRWLGERLELIGALIVFLTAALGVAARNSLDPAVLGLSLSYAVMITQILTWLVRQVVETENNLNAVERSKFYADQIPQERAAEMGDDAIVENKFKSEGKKWPLKGEIVFKDLTMRYRPDLPLVLNGVNAKIRGGERVGVVGRTGAGKSSLMLALFRLVEASSGSIIVDGVDIGKLGLEYLRSRLAIIPQDPVLYSGTIRSNLDPFTQYSDNQLWSVLEKVYMKDAVSALEQKLEAPVSENGENFSVGQRAQICLARAMLREAKILIMDEATASIDMETDTLIQESVRRQFQCTILTIAHRLNTIIDYDRVMVLSHGQIVEYDSPAALLRKKDSELSRLVDETGEVNAALLRQIAFNAERSIEEQRKRFGTSKTMSNVFANSDDIPVAHAKVELPLLTLQRHRSQSTSKKDHNGTTTNGLSNGFSNGRSNGYHTTVLTENQDGQTREISVSRSTITFHLDGYHVTD